jgi:hypothetical protein
MVVILSSTVEGVRIHLPPIERARHLDVRSSSPKMGSLDETVGHRTRVVVRVDAVGHSDGFSIDVCESSVSVSLQTGRATGRIRTGEEGTHNSR